MEGRELPDARLNLLGNKQGNKLLQFKIAEDKKQLEPIIKTKRTGSWYHKIFDLILVLY